MPNSHQFPSILLKVIWVISRRLYLRSHWSLALQICRSSSCRSHLLLHLFVCLQDVLDLFTFLRHDTHCSGWVDLVITIYHNISPCFKNCKPWTLAYIFNQTQINSRYIASASQKVQKSESQPMAQIPRIIEQQPTHNCQGLKGLAYIASPPCTTWRTETFRAYSCTFICTSILSLICSTTQRVMLKQWRFILLHCVSCVEVDGSSPDCAWQVLTMP